jgi:precorrin-6B methylase 2
MAFMSERKITYEIVSMSGERVVMTADTQKGAKAIMEDLRKKGTETRLFRIVWKRIEVFD